MSGELGLVCARQILHARKAPCRCILHHKVLSGKVLRRDILRGLSARFFSKLIRHVGLLETLRPDAETTSHGFLRSRSLNIDRTVRSMTVDISQPLPHIKIELNGSVNFLFPPQLTRRFPTGSISTVPAHMEHALADYAPTQVAETSAPQDSAKRRQIMEEIGRAHV